MPLATGIRSAPTTEMYTRCRAPARDAARTRCRALSSSPLALPAQMHDDLGSLHRGVDPLARGQVTGHELDPSPSSWLASALAAAPAEHPDVAPGVPQPRDDQPPQGARAAGDQDG